MKKTKPIELPKQLHNWLFDLKKGLKKLRNEDRDDILLSYVEQFNEQLNEGMSAEQILTELRPISEIVPEIYAEFDLDPVIKIHDKKRQTVVKVKIKGAGDQPQKKASTKTLTVMSFFLSLGVWVSTFLIGMIAVLLPIAVIFSVTIIYINFDPYFATSLAIIFLGALPFGDVFCFFLTKTLYRASLKMTAPFKQRNRKKFGIKWWMILLIVGGICSALILGIGMGTTYQNGFIDSALHYKYQHQQELLSFATYQELAEAIEAPKLPNEKVTEEMVREYFINSANTDKFSVNASHYYRRKSIPGENQQELNLKIIRDYNLKESYKLDLSLMKIQADLLPDEKGQLKIINLKLVLPDLEWYNYAISWQPETLEFIYN